MDWARFKCWFKGHDVRKATAVITEDKKYHGHVTTRQYNKCHRCGKGTLENELNYWSDEKNLWERHDTLITTLTVIGVCIGVLIGIFLLVGLCTLALFPMMAYTCKVGGAEMGLAAKYNYWTGCYFNVDGRWIHESLLNVVDILK
jgi:hypothetical protein